MAEYERYRMGVKRDFRERAAEYTADGEWQEKIVIELWKLHQASAPPSKSGR